MSYLTEAFKQMNLLESEQFTFDGDGAAKLANFLDDDMLNDFETIIDPEAETKEELKDSYMGNVICRCPICKQLIYRDPEEVVIDEEEQLANIEEPCPYCFEAGGYEIVGQVAPFEEVTVEAEDGTKVEVDGQEVETATNTDPETEGDEEEILKESLFDRLVQKFPELADETSSDVRARRHTRDNEDIEDSQRFPVEGTNQRNLVERRCAKRRHVRDNEDLEDSQRYPIESPVGTKGLNEDFDTETGSKAWNEKTIAFYTQAASKLNLKDFNMTVDRNNNAIITATKNGKSLQGKLNYNDSQDVSSVDDAVEAIKFAVQELQESLKESSFDKEKETFSKLDNSTNKIRSKKRHTRDNEDLEDSQRYPIESPAPAQTGLREGMEDISITTDDQVIKVKATPRADKETIQPVEDETKEVIEETPIEEEVPEDMSTEDQDVEIEDFDEESFDSLGEGYLKNVYGNVSTFKTLDVKNQKNNLIVEGVISFNSGKKAKTKFIFEAKDATKGGKLRFSGLNENISPNKKAFTLTGTLKDNKLILESLNYNYSAKDSDGKSKRLYGTIRN